MMKTVCLAAVLLSCGDREREKLVNGPLLDVTPTDLVATYSKNEVEGDRLYKGKALRLTATVDKITKDSDGTPLVYLHTYHHDVDPDAVICALDSSGDYNLPRGPMVVLRGIGAGVKAGVPTLSMCSPDR